MSSLIVYLYYSDDVILVLVIDRGGSLNRIHYYTSVHVPSPFFFSHVIIRGREIREIMGHGH